MKFLFHFYDLEQRAGIQRAICELSNAMVDFGHEVVVVTHSRAESVAYALDRRVRIVTTRHPEYKKSGLTSWPVKMLWAVRQIRELRKLIKLHHPDIVVDHGTALGLLFPFQMLGGVPFVLQRHFPGRSFPYGKLLYPILATLCFSKMVVVLTEGIAHEMQNLGFRRVSVIPNVIPADAKPAPWPTGEPRIGLLMGRGLTPQKGFDIFLEALACCRPSGWQFRIVGPGIDADPVLKRLVEANKLEFNVSLSPASDDPYALIRQCSLLIMPSRYEALPMVALEALKIGRPILASDAEGLREIVVSGVNGLLVPVGDVELLSAALMRLCSAPDILAGFAKHASASVSGYDTKTIADRWIRLAMDLNDAVAGDRL